LVFWFLEGLKIYFFAKSIKFYPYSFGRALVAERFLSS
jgi:hypothetical protein